MIKFGMHIGGGESLSKGEVESLKGRVETVQIFATPPMRGDFPVMKPERVESWLYLINNFDVVVHAPYWANVMDSERVHRLVNYVRELGKQFSFGIRLKFVVHIGMGTEGRTVESLKKLRETAKKLLEATELVGIYIENTAGAKGKQCVTLQDLVELRSDVEGLGLVLDTEHAYAAGEDIDKIELGPFEIIHMNAIPWYVKKGGHLDRHSFTSLSEGKPDILPVIDKLKNVGGDRLVIMERRVRDVSFRDIKFIKERLENGFDREEGKVAESIPVEVPVP